VSHPAEALAVFRPRPEDFDVVISDQAMPEMSGLALARALLEIRADVPIILCSGLLGGELAIAAKEIGVRKLLAKPYTAPALAHALDEVFGSRV
jgi:CheY-like chemotaxis protein